MLLRKLSVVIVLDLSAPNELWLTLEKLLAELKSQINAVINEAKDSDPKVKERLLMKAWERVGEDHPVCMIFFLCVSARS